MLIAVEECKSRILKKSKAEGSDIDDDDGENETDEESRDFEEEKVEKHKARGPSEYPLRRERNIEENKKILAELKKKNPIGEKGEVKGALLSNKEVIDKVREIVTSDPTPTLSTPSTSSITGSHRNSSLEPANETTQPTIQVPNSDSHRNGSLEPANETTYPTIQVPNPGSSTPSTSSITGLHRNGSLEFANETTQPTIQVPSTVTAEQKSDAAQVDATTEAIISSLADNKKEIIPGIETAQPAIDSVQPAINSVGSSLHPGNERPTCFDDTITTGYPPSQLNTENQSGNNDVVMDDEHSEISTSPEDDLPPWLVPMIRYLREVTEDIAWRNLVNMFLMFERQRPPNGVSSHFYAFLSC